MATHSSILARKIPWTEEPSGLWSKELQRVWHGWSNWVHIKYIFEMWKCTALSHVRLFSTPWTIVYQVPLSMGFFRQEYWNGLPFPSPTDLRDPGIQLISPGLQAGSLSAKPKRKIRKVKVVRRSIMSDSLQPHGLQSTRNSNFLTQLIWPFPTEPPSTSAASLLLPFCQALQIHCTDTVYSCTCCSF